MTHFTDKVGKPLELGDHVVFASYKNLGLTIGRIQKIGRVRVHVYADKSTDRVAPWLESGWVETFNPDSVVKV